MEQEYRVLTHLQDNEITTQRKISSRTGLSLGAVNLLLKKMVRKGLIKIEKLNPRTVRYILTPKGMQEKARLSYRYIRQSYRQLLKINQALDGLLAERKQAGNGRAVVLFGPGDEIQEILAQHLSEKGITFELCLEKDTPAHAPGSDQDLILTWREEEEEKAKAFSGAVNIMKVL